MKTDYFLATKIFSLYFIKLLVYLAYRGRNMAPWAGLKTTYCAILLRGKRSAVRSMSACTIWQCLAISASIRITCIFMFPPLCQLHYYTQMLHKWYIRFYQHHPYYQIKYLQYVHIHHSKSKILTRSSLCSLTKLGGGQNYVLQITGN